MEVLLAIGKSHGPFYSLFNLTYIAFGVCLFKSVSDAGSILEWTIAFVFTFYIASFFIDLRPAVRTKRNKTLSGETEEQAEMTSPD